MPSKVLKLKRVKMYPVICQLWEESERGWGTRPSGHSLHIDRAARAEFIKEHWALYPDGPPPDCYCRPYLFGYVAEVDGKTYRKVKASKNGIWGNGASWAEKPREFLSE